jgi:monothiol glutaredoxin
MSRNVLDEIKKEVAENKVVLYMKGTASAPRCGFSARAAGTLRELGVPFKDVDVLADPEKWQAVKTFSDWPTIPQVYIGGQFIGGGDQLAELNDKGELQAMLDKVLED